MFFNVKADGAGAYVLRPDIVPDSPEPAEKNPKPWEKSRESKREQAEEWEEIAEEWEETPEELEEETEGEAGENDYFFIDQPRNGTPYRRKIAGLASGAGYLLSVALILLHAPVQAWAVVLVITSAVFVAADPLQLVTLVAAPQTRFITAVNMLLWAALPFVPDIRYIAVIVTVAGVSVVICGALNGRWLHSSRILRSPAVLHATVKDKNNAAVVAWRDYGKREVRTILLESKLDFSEQIVNSYGLACFVSGFYAAEKNVRRLKRELAQVCEELEQEKENRIGALIDRKAAQETIEQAQAAQNEVKRITERYNAVTTENYLLQAENKRLKAFVDSLQTAEPAEILEADTAAAPPDPEQVPPVNADIEAEAARIREEKEAKQAAEDEKTREYVAKVKEMLKQTDENGKCLFGGAKTIARHLDISVYFAKKYIALASAELEAEKEA